MYSLVSVKKNKIRIFYNVKTDKFSRLEEEFKLKKEGNPDLRLFGLISLFNVCASVVSVNLDIPPLCILVGIYTIAILTGVSIFLIIKSKQCDELKKYEINKSKVLEIDVLKYSSYKIHQTGLTVALLILSLSFLCSIYFYYNTSTILLLILIMGLLFFGTIISCDPLLYFLVAKRKALRSCKEN